MNLENAH